LVGSLLAGFAARCWFLIALAKFKGNLSMGYLADGFAWGARPGFYRALSAFQHEFATSEGDMQLACHRFLGTLDYQCVVRREWELKAGSIVFVSELLSALDGFAIPLVCPSKFTIRRVVFHLTASWLGRNFARHSVLVWPRGSYRNLIFQNKGFLDRISYLITHRWGWWVRPARALTRMVEVVNSGESLMLLPSGTVGDLHWRRGVGALVKATSPEQPVFLAPVYLDWDDEHRRVFLHAPKLISFDWIRQQAGNLDSQELSTWLEERYRRKDWSTVS